MVTKGDPSPGEPRCPYLPARSTSSSSSSSAPRIFSASQTSVDARSRHPCGPHKQARVLIHGARDHEPLRFGHQHLERTRAARAQSTSRVTTA